VTSLPALRTCGHAVTNLAEFVEVRLGEDDRAFTSGVQTCSSVHACPVCSAAIREKRAREVEAAATVVLSTGFVLFLTLTASHHRSDRLSDLLKDLATAWHDVTSNRLWRETPALRGFVKTTEITDGFPNGWHPHVHALVFFDRVLDPAEVATFGAYVRTAWARSITGRAGRDVNEHGVRVQQIRMVAGRADVGEYLAKVQDGYGASRSVGREMTRGDLKSGRKVNRFSAFELLERATYGDVVARARWLEYEQATKGRRCLEWSRSEWVKDLRARAGASAEVDSAQQYGGRVIVELTLGEWALVAGYGRQAQLLDAVERRGVGGCMELLRALRRRDDHERARAARKKARVSA
jgi:hypothetical protein